MRSYHFSERELPWGRLIDATAPNPRAPKILSSPLSFLSILASLLLHVSTFMLMYSVASTTYFCILSLLGLLLVLRVKDEYIIDLFILNLFFLNALFHSEAALILGSVGSSLAL